MEDRLTRAVKKGDAGLTFLADGFQVEKNSPRVEFIGTIDELNSWIGVIVASCGSDALKSILEQIQHDIMNL